MTKKDFEHFKRGFIQGFGWAIGVTLGFAFVSTVLAILVSRAGGLPLIGSFIASIVDATLKALQR